MSRVVEDLLKEKEEWAKNEKINKKQNQLFNTYKEEGIGYGVGKAEEG